MSLIGFPVAAASLTAAGLLSAWPWLSALFLVCGACAMSAIDGYGEMPFLPHGDTVKLETIFLTRGARAGESGLRVPLRRRLKNMGAKDRHDRRDRHFECQQGLQTAGHRRVIDMIVGVIVGSVDDLSMIGKTEMAVALTYDDDVDHVDLLQLYS